MPPAATRLVRLSRIACGLAAAGGAVPASAQVAIEAAVMTDYRVRGYSISDEKPAASLSLSYDDPSGAYLGGTVIGSIYRGDPAVVGVQANAGYATRISPALSLDVGISKTQYFNAYRTRWNYDYTEVYLGLALPVVSARLSYSPDYYRTDMDTLYAEVAGGFEPAPDWLLSAHGGVLTYLGDPPASLPDQTFDWRIGASRQFGPWGLHLDLSGRVQDHAHYAPPSSTDPQSHDDAVVLNLTRAF